MGPFCPHLAFATPRKLPKVKDLEGLVVVLDVAFASEASHGGFDRVTLPFLQGLGDRLVAWVDHHDHAMHTAYASDRRFVLSTKAQHGACPELVTPELVARVGHVDTIVCHTDFDGIMSAAKWMRGGIEPYPGADADARAVDTRMGTPSPSGDRIDRALRARPRDLGLLGLVARHLREGVSDTSLWAPIDQAAEGLASREQASRRLAQSYRVVAAHIPVGTAQVPGGALRFADRVAFVDATGADGAYDRTLLLMMGQERADVAIVLDHDTVCLAAAFDSSVSFLSLLGLSGGMPTLVSVGKSRLPEVWQRLGVDPAAAPA